MDFEAQCVHVCFRIVLSVLRQGGIRSFRIMTARSMKIY